MQKTKLKKLNHEKIKERRLLLNFTLKEMAEQMGMSNQSQYYKHENGLHRWKADQLPLLAKILHCEIEDFFD